jgi:hypothetical protein
MAALPTWLPPRVQKSGQAARRLPPCRSHCRRSSSIEPTPSAFNRVGQETEAMRSPEQGAQHTNRRPLKSIQRPSASLACYSNLHVLALQTSPSLQPRPCGDAPGRREVDHAETTPPSIPTTLPTKPQHSGRAQRCPMSRCSVRPVASLHNSISVVRPWQPSKAGNLDRTRATRGRGAVGLWRRVGV